MRAEPVRDIGKIEVIAENKTLPIRVSANTPELNALALQAFGTHGRYRVVASGFAFDIKFSAVTPTQVRVDITTAPSGTPVASEVLTGSSARNALVSPPRPMAHQGQATSETKSIRRDLAMPRPSALVFQHV